MVQTAYRKGALGALLDEYQRALAEYIRVIEGVPDDLYAKILDSETEDEDCRSIQTICRHVIRAGYGYVTYMQEFFGVEVMKAEVPPPEKGEVAGALTEMFSANEKLLTPRMNLDHEELFVRTFKVRWGPTFNLEQLLEHAIVHVLRHRRQVEKFLTL